MENEKQWHYCEYTTKSFIRFQSLCCKEELVLKTIDKILKKDDTANTKCFEKDKGIDFDELVNIWCKKEEKEMMKSVDLIIGINNKNKDKKYLLLIENKYNVISTRSMRSSADLEKKYEDSTTVLQELSQKDILNGYIATDDIDIKQQNAIVIKQQLVVLAQDETNRSTWARISGESKLKLKLIISTSEKFYKDYFSHSPAS